MFVRNWQGRLVPTANRAARRRRRKLLPKLQSLEPRTLLSVTPTGVTFAPIEASAFTGTVATFTADDAGPFTANIDWGDGTITPGTVNPNGGGFDVTGTHTYAEDGSESVSVVINDAADATTATAASTANVHEGNFGMSAGGTLNATEGQAASFQVATFNDPGSSDATTDFIATVDWGDGQTTSGTISGGAGSFTVTGSHTYADELNGNYSVTVSEPAANFTFGPVGDPVIVAEGDNGTLISATVNTTEGQSFSGAVAMFTDNNTGQVASDFTSTIDWGDGATTSGSVTGGAGIFTISGQHIYADEGAFQVLATFADDAPSTLSATINSTAQVSEADILTPAASQPTVSPIENLAFTGNVAVFTDTGNPGNVASDLTANINWGDGTTDVGVPVSGGNGADFTVSGTHTYAEDGRYTITTTLADNAPGTAGAIATSTATVTEMSLSITAAPIAATEGQPFSGVVATAADPGSTDPASDYSATIVWGDGTTTSGTVSGAAGAYTISGNHTYADEGTQAATITFIENNSPNFPISINDSATVAESDTLAPSFITTGTIVEDEFVGGTAAVFSDAGYPGNSAADFTATFDWGDGTTFSTGTGNVTITNDGSGNLTLSVAGHSYADEGVYTVVATLSDDAPGTASISQTGTLTAIEADAFTPALAPATITGTEGATASGTVAVFADTGYPTNSTGDFNATVDWGDGSTTPGAISTAGDGNFTIGGSHVYAEEGVYTITATIVDDAPGSVTASTTAIADIAEGDLTLTAATPTLVATEGTAASGVVATISDPGSLDPATDYAATIDWGDGATTAGTISGAAGSYAVSGSHTYADEGTYNVTVVASESGVPTAVTATFVGNVLEADHLTGVASAQATEGITFNGGVATFTDTGYPGNTAGDFTATIEWGDGTTTAGSVAGSGGMFTVSGQHLYGSEGSYPLVVMLTDNSPGTATATASGLAAVADNDTLVPGASATVAATEGATFSGALATFTDTTYPGNVPGDFLATIDWGDGTTISGTVSGTPGSFTVSGSHLYTEEGVKTATIVLADDTPNSATGTATATVQIADAALVAAGALLIAPTEGAAVTGVVATFGDLDPNRISTDYTALIAWGDGSTSTGTVAANGAGGFDVTGTHTYSEEGPTVVTVTIADVGGSTATASSSVYVHDAALSSSPVVVAPIEGISFTGVVANFTDADSNGAASDYTASIVWGDGGTTSGTVAANGSGGFEVTGTHTYLEEGTNSIRVTVSDAGGSTVLVLSTADVADAPLSAAAVDVTTPELTPFTGVVATFTDADPNDAPADYTATIDWGDGSTSTGTVATAANGFNVTGSHTYTEDGIHAVVVTIIDAGGSTASSTGTATVTEPSIVPSPVSIVGHEHLALNNVTVATFLHGNGAEPASGFTATIQWGDGTSSTGAISESGNVYTVVGSHTYLDEQTAAVVVQINDDASSAVATSSAKISEELLPDGSVGTANERFISELYRDLLHRQVDASALPFWTDQLAQGQTRLQVAEAIIKAAMPNELGNDLVQGMYQKFLGREADAGGLVYWSGVLNQNTLEDTEAALVATPEFFAQAGGTNNGYIDRLFQVALGRAPDASGRAQFETDLAAGMSREQIAQIVFSSHEYHQDLVGGDYRSPVDNNDRSDASVSFLDDLDFLDRPADPNGLAAFTAALDHGTAEQQVWADFLSSDEFFAKTA